MGISADPARTASFEFEFPRLLPAGKRPASKPQFEARYLTARQLADVEDQINAAFVVRGKASLQALIAALGMVIVSGQLIDAAGKVTQRGGGEDATRWSALADVYEQEQLWLLYRAAMDAIRPTDAELGKSESTSDDASVSSAVDASMDDA